MPPASTPGDTPAAPPPANPPAPAGNPEPPAPSPQPTPNGSEPDSNSGGQQQPAMVPSDRLREETEARRKAEERLAQLEAEREEAAKAKPQAGDDLEIDPDVQKILDTYAKRNGFVTQEELNRVRQDAEVRVQVQQDVAELKGQYKDYDHQKVVAFAKENNMPITSKTSLEAAYTLMNRDSLLEAERKRAVAEFQEGNKSGGEKPGPGGAKPPENPQPKSLRERIHLARTSAQ